MTPFRTFVAIFAVTFLALTSYDLVQGQDACQTAISQLLTTCLGQSNIIQANFLWFVSNATSPSGTAPTDQNAFKTSLCAAEQKLGPCIFGQLPQLANTTCQSNQALPIKMAQYIFTYDMKCADPCRFTLADDMRNCYTNNKLSADLFLSNRSSGSVIGSNKADVDSFCMQKDGLFSCMDNIYSTCPDATPLLQQVNFHLPSYKKGVGILCTHSQEYLMGLKCFAETTPEVDACAQKNQQAFLQVAVEAQSKNWTQQQFISATCKITMDQADCDINAWHNKKDPSCTTGVVGLRREMECSLMPQNCTMLQKDHYNLICQADKFFSQDRVANGGSGGTSAAGTAGGSTRGGGGAGFVEVSRSLLLLALAMVILPYFKK